MRALLVAMLWPLSALAEDRAGDFDYYVLSLSWSPSWCAMEGDARASPQCDPERGFGWVLHGLWPHYERGWPSYCRSAARNPTRAETAAMADISGTPGLAWHAWNKHGRCSGLSAAGYFAAARKAYDAIVRPDVLRRLDRTVTLPASVIEAAFLEANPELRSDMITITCKAGRIEEARICLTRNLQPRTCGADIVRDCQMKDALFAPVR